ncbi:hypothetical protein JCM21531_553 [Acetivibrio straminisolvens JCM 21531]|jgi:ribosomal protein L37AE/L43A|uniref:Zn-finger containing protein n=2 Tax=Acetivibrio straminisolvens TaxID=253314 RepID=W4V254_9FIRM|nr:hypothetical protein JCM21531_553 [Acetivibrio straminisolvens JCM 21531]
MADRYGSDRLSIFLIILSIILNFIGNLLKTPVFGLIGYIPLAISIYRMLSKNITRRRMENYKFVMFTDSFTAWFKKAVDNITIRIRDAKTHRYFSCPDCRAKLRVPKGKGTIIITCPKCKTEFKKKT